MDAGVKIVDNFLDPIDLKEVCKRSSPQHAPVGAQWTIQASNERGSEKNDNTQAFLELDVSKEKFFTTTIFNQIKKHLKGEYKIDRIYFNGQWSGREGDFHRDLCDVTVLLYCSPYQYGWGGFTEIMTSPTEPILVHPLENRLCIFKGSIIHKGYSFSYQHCPMRKSLAYKLISNAEDLKWK